MLLGRDKLEAEVAALADRIEEDSEDELAEIDEVFIVAAVHYGRTDDGNGEVGALFYRCSSARTYVQIGLVEQARRAIKAVRGQE